MNGPLLIPVLFLLVGVVAIVWPARLADAKEKIDAVGSTREHRLDEVESISSQVFLVRVVGITLVFLGLVALWMVLG